MKRPHIPWPRGMLALLTAGVDYWLTIAPAARGELRRWQHRARLIPDLTLREHALKKLSSEVLNSEGATIFALLAPRTGRQRLVRLIVAYQVMYDYLDGVNENPAFLSLRDGLRLHRALLDVVQSGPTPTDYYTHRPEHDDGGYLNDLVGTCRDTLGTLPSREVVIPALVVAATRCCEAQAHNHAGAVEGYEQFINWSEQQAPTSGYLWWELAAAGVSSLALHGLLAAAAMPNMTSREVQRIGAAYFPAICAISTLLDSLIDLARDTETANHSFAGYYTSSNHAAERYAAIIADADKQLGRLRYARRHRIILAGIAGYYLSAPEARYKFAQTVRTRAIGATGAMIWPILAIMRVRRLKHGAALPRRDSAVAMETKGAG